MRSATSPGRCPRCGAAQCPFHSRDGWASAGTRVDHACRRSGRWSRGCAGPGAAGSTSSRTASGAPRCRWRWTRCGDRAHSRGPTRGAAVGRAGPRPRASTDRRARTLARSPSTPRRGRSRRRAPPGGRPACQRRKPSRTRPSGPRPGTPRVGGGDATDRRSRPAPPRVPRRTCCARRAASRCSASLPERGDDLRERAPGCHDLPAVIAAHPGEGRRRPPLARGHHCGALPIPQARATRGTLDPRGRRQSVVPAEMRPLDDEPSPQRGRACTTAADPTPPTSPRCGRRGPPSACSPGTSCVGGRRSAAG